MVVCPSGTVLWTLPCLSTLVGSAYGRHVCIDPKLEFRILYESAWHSERKDALTQWTIVAWHLARRATPFVRYPAYATHISLAVLIVITRVRYPGIPPPLSYSVPFFDGHLHRSRGRSTCSSNRSNNAARTARACECVM